MNLESRGQTGRWVGAGVQHGEKSWLSKEGLARERPELPSQEDEREKKSSIKPGFVARTPLVETREQKQHAGGYGTILGSLKITTH